MNKVELFNSTNEIRRIPRYRYDGKYVLGPKESVEINSDQAFFFKPYAKIGVLVRNVISENKEPKKEVENVEVVKEDKEEKETESKEVNFVEVKTENTESGVVNETEKVEEITSEPVEAVETPNETTGYTEESLAGKKAVELRTIAESLGIDTTGLSKIQLKEAILSK